VGQKILRRAAILLVLPLAAALGLEAPRRSVSGNISLSASPTGARAYLSMALPFDVLINASAPLSFDEEALGSSSFTVKGKLGGLSLAAGKLKISDAAGFLARPDLVSSRGTSLLYSANLGNAGDPLGIAAASQRLSLFLTRGEPYTCGALQYLLLERAARLAIGLGTLLGGEDQGSVVHRLRPWLASGAGYCASNVSFLARLQLYPDFEAASGDFFDFAWLKAAACRLDISWSSPRQKIKGFLYAEAGDFVSATGKVASRDALARIDYDADISCIPLVRNLSVSLSAFSKQGVAETAVQTTPSFGTFPDYLALKYWPDGGEGDFSIENKELRVGIFGAVLVLGSSFSGAVVKKPGEWSGKFGFDLDMRSARPPTPRSAASQPAASPSTAPQLGLGFALQTSCPEQENASEADGDFSDISEYEESEDASATVQTADSTLILDRALIALRAASGSFSCRISVDIPLRSSDSDALRVKIRASAKMAHFLLEASGTADFETAEKRFSIASAHFYVKIPL
jgi:hypothetical protein